MDPQGDLAVVDKTCVQIAKALRKAGANLNHVDAYGANAVAMGAIRGMKHFTEYLLKARVLVDLADLNGVTPLMKAAAHAHIDIFIMLVSKGANITAVDSQHGLSALHYAVNVAKSADGLMFEGYLDQVLAVIPRDAVDQRDALGRTPLAYAVLSGAEKVARELLGKGADPQVLDSFGVPVTSMTRGNDEMYRLLIEAAATQTEERQRIWMEQRDKDDLLDKISKEKRGNRDSNRRQSAAGLGLSEDEF